MRKILQLAVFIASFGAFAAFAADGKVNILSPADGATVDSKAPLKLSFDVVPGPGGDHLHLNVDGKRVDIIHEFKGSAMLDPLPAGRHQLCLQVNTKAHVPTGVEGCVNVTAK